MKALEVSSLFIYNLQVSNTPADNFSIVLHNYLIIIESYLPKETK